MKEKVPREYLMSDTLNRTEKKKEGEWEIYFIYIFFCVGNISNKIPHLLERYRKSDECDWMARTLLPIKLSKGRV